jgi:glutamate/tyrosine decarboxylase-like PLP-dependent enzyme
MVKIYKRLFENPVIDMHHTFLSSNAPGPFEMFKMEGIYSMEALVKNARFSNRNLSYNYDKVVGNMALEVIFATMDIIQEREGGGILFYSGSEANEVAMAIARQKTNRNKVLATNLSHKSINAKAKKLGMETIIVDVEPDTFKINLEKVAKAVNGQEKDIALIVATGPTTQLGNYEQFNNAHFDLLHKGARFHIDNAPGLIPNLVNKKDIEKRFGTNDKHSSITVDPHKLFGIYGCGALILKEYNEDRKHTLENVNYFPSLSPYAATTHSALPLAIAHTMAFSLGKIGLKEIAKDCVDKKQKVVENFSGIIESFYNGSDVNMVTFKLPYDKVEKFCNEMLKQNYRVSPFKLEGKDKNGKDYALGGFSVCVGPRPSLTYKVIEDFCEKTIDVYRKLK